MTKPLRESATLLEAGTGPAGSMLIQIISPGWGSSGYYSEDVVKEAAGLVTRGTHMYADHQPESDRINRPGRSVLEIAAFFTEDARWDETRGALVAEAQAAPRYRDDLTFLAEHIGVSISGSATDIVVGEAEGRRGPIVEGLAAIDSVDFVTRAGRGGSFEVIESALPSVVRARAVRRGVQEATADERRRYLSDAVRSAYGSDDRYAWVQDFDDTRVWFEASADDEASHTWEQTYTVADDDLSVSLTGQRIEVRPVTTYVPVNAAGQSTTQESEEDTMPNIEEARLRQLEEDAGRVTVLESERNTAIAERDEARRERDELRAREAATIRARARISEANADLHSTVVDRIVTEATRQVPLTEAGQLDEAAFDTAVDEARTREENYLASLAEHHGTGRPRGLGGTTAGIDADELSEADINKAVADAFGLQVKEA